MEYKLIYSDRKTLGLTIKNGEVIVRAPRRVSKKIIEKFVAKHKDWIEKHLEKSKNNLADAELLTESEITELKCNAKKYFDVKTRCYSNIMNINYSRIKITSAKTRYGSCSSKGNICYSYRLMLFPEAAREYVVVHELAHRIEMNHSKKFYKIVETYLPDYKERKKLLR